MCLTSRAYGEEELDQLVEAIDDSMDLTEMADPEASTRRLPVRGLVTRASEMLIIAITRLTRSGYQGAEPYVNHAEALLRRALSRIGWHMPGVRTELNSAIRDLQSARRDRKRRATLLRQALWHIQAARAAV